MSNLGSTVIQRLDHLLGGGMFSILQRYFGRKRGLLIFRWLYSLSVFCAMPTALEHCFNATGFDREFGHVEASLGKLDNTEVIWLTE
jgi:hypothetical protein